MMAGSVLTVLPVLLVFLALQRYYIAGPDGRQRQGMTATRRCCDGADPAGRRPRRRATRADAGPAARRRGGADARRLRGPRAVDAPALPTACSCVVHAGRRAGRPRAAPRLRPRRHRGLRARATRRLPLDLPENYEIVVLRCAATHRSTTSRSSSSTRAATTSGGSAGANFEFPRDWQHGPDQEAPDRVRVGTDEGPHAAAVAAHRVRRRGRPRRRHAARS